MRRVAGAVAAMAVMWGASPLAAVPRAADPTVGVLLARVDAYLVGFAKAYAEVVAEERYLQTMRPKRVILGMTTTTTERREIKSDVVAVSDSTQTWLNFRDVFAVDGTPVRDRDERLAKLFLNQSGDPLAKARSIADEGARFNLGTVSRNINFPSMALTFLATANRTRSTFRLRGHARVAGVDTLIVSFEETRRPTLVKSGAADVPVSGRFWIEPVTGRVLKTDMRFESREFSGDVEVTYGHIDKLDIWLPVEMDDTCSGPRETVTGRATYGNFRKFGTSVVIK